MAIIEINALKKKGISKKNIFSNLYIPEYEFEKSQHKQTEKDERGKKTFFEQMKNL